MTSVSPLIFSFGLIFFSASTTFSPAASNSQPPVFNVMSYGAKANGTADDTIAINKAIAAAEAAGGSVYLPGTSKSYIYSSCLFFSGITLYGDGDKSLLQASDPHNSAVVLEGSSPALRHVKIISPHSTTIGRQSTPQTAGVVMYQATNFTVDTVHIDTTASVGIMSFSSGGTAIAPAVISNCTVANTLADGIHLTDGSCYITESNNTVTNSGDDMFAVVSYMSDGSICHDITITGNSGSGQSANGRGVSVVGGNNVSILNNTIQNVRAAGIYLQSELVRNSMGALVYKTYGDDSITVKGNTLTNLATNVPHGGINIGGRPADILDPGQIETQDVLITNVTLSGNTITNSHHSGVTLQGYFDHVSLESNTIDTTAEQGMDIVGGSNLFIGNSAGNTFKKIGGCGIHLYTNVNVRTLTGGSVVIENNIFGDTNVNGTTPIPIIAVGLSEDECQISGNQFNVSGKYPISTPYVLYDSE